MRKIHILKAIIDFLWVVSILAVLIIAIMVPMLFFSKNLTGITTNLSNIKIPTITLFGKIITSILVLSYGLLFYSLHLFRKTLHYFLELKIFDSYIIKTYQKIGSLLTIWGVISLIISFISKIYFEQRVEFGISLNSPIIILCLGLFFMILSEIFKIAKKAKQENDLTI